jgi:uncharacterized protein (TIGR03067 family)
MTFVTANFLFAIPAMLAAAQATVPKELEALQGRWQIVAIDGKDVGPDVQAGFTVTGDQYSQGVNGKLVERGSLKVDTTQKPNTIDFIITAGASQGKTQLGIIQITGDTVTIKVNQPGATVRPKDFTPSEGFEVVTARRRTS